MLAPVQSIRAGIEFFRRGIPYRDGLRLGLSYKAIAQTLHFLDSALKEPIDAEELERNCRLAWDLLTKHPYQIHREVIANIADTRGFELASQAVAASPQLKQIVEDVRLLPKALVDRLK